jgi:hypothetical protein
VKLVRVSCVIPACVAVIVCDACADFMALNGVNSPLAAVGTVRASDGLVVPSFLFGNVAVPYFEPSGVLVAATVHKQLRVEE